MSRENARWLYLAQIGTEEFKIGVSLTPDWRARELQAHNKGWVRIARQWQFDDRAFLIESLVKGLLCNAGLRSPAHPRSREYFVADHKQMLAAVECAQYLAQGTCPRLICELLYRLTRPATGIDPTWYLDARTRRAMAFKRTISERHRQRDKEARGSGPRPKPVKRKKRRALR